MAKQIVVSSAQRSAASAMVKRSTTTGRFVSKSVRKIASAKIRPLNGSQAAEPQDSRTA